MNHIHTTNPTANTLIYAAVLNLGYFANRTSQATSHVTVYTFESNLERDKVLRHAEKCIVDPVVRDAFDRGVLEK